MLLGPVRKSMVLTGRSSLALVALGVILASSAAAETKKSADRIYCERMAGGDYRRLKICLSYMTNVKSQKQSPPPGVKKKAEPKSGDAPPTVKGKSRSGYAFISDTCYSLYSRRFRSLRVHKAFATAKRKGFEVCGGSYGHPTIAKANSDALKACRGRAERDGVDVGPCKLIESH